MEQGDSVTGTTTRPLSRSLTPGPAMPRPGTEPGPDPGWGWGSLPGHEEEGRATALQ